MLHNDKDQITNKTHDLIRSEIAESENTWNSVMIEQEGEIYKSQIWSSVLQKLWHSNW